MKDIILELEDIERRLNNTDKLEPDVVDMRDLLLRLTQSVRAIAEEFDKHD